MVDMERLYHRIQEKESGVFRFPQRTSSRSFDSILKLGTPYKEGHRAPSSESPRQDAPCLTAASQLRELIPTNTAKCSAMLGRVKL